MESKIKWRLGGTKDRVIDEAKMMMICKEGPESNKIGFDHHAALFLANLVITDLTDSSNCWQVKTLW